MSDSRDNEQSRKPKLLYELRNVIDSALEAQEGQAIFFELYLKGLKKYESINLKNGGVS